MKRPPTEAAVTRSRNRRHRPSCGSPPPPKYCRASWVWFSIVPELASEPRGRHPARIRTVGLLDRWSFACLEDRRKTGPLPAPIANVAEPKVVKMNILPRSHNSPQLWRRTNGDHL